jgi:hypothetical protein
MNLPVTMNFRKTANFARIAAIPARKRQFAQQLHDLIFGVSFASAYIHRGSIFVAGRGSQD